MGKRDQEKSKRNISRDRRSAAERVPGPAKKTHVQDPTQAPPPPRKRRPKKSEPLSVPWWGFLLVIVLVGGITCGLWAYVLSLRSEGPAVAELGPSPTPIFVVITATPTLDTGSGATTAPEGQLPTATVQGLTPTVTSAPENREIVVGGNVTITGTGGDGLSIRQGPGLQFGIFAVGEEGEVFAVEDGPRESDGFTWWYIVDPSDEDRAGWAAQNFLSAGP